MKSVCACTVAFKIQFPLHYKLAIPGLRDSCITIFFYATTELFFTEDPCIGHECQNGARCVPHSAIINHSVAYYTCVCTDGFRGHRCDDAIPTTSPPTTEPVEIVSPITFSAGFKQYMLIIIV